MNNRLRDDILNSSTIRNYIKFQKLSKYVYTFKWIAVLTFAIGFLDIVFDDYMHPATMGMLVMVWSPAITFAMLGALLHFTAMQEVHIISTKYEISSIEVMKIARDLISAE
jgi:hypothetical protein